MMVAWLYQSARVGAIVDGLRSCRWRKEATTHLGLAQIGHGVEAKRCEPDRVESAVALEFVHRVKNGIVRAAEILVRSDKVSLEIVRPDLGLEAGDDPEVVPGASEGPPEVRVSLFVDADCRSVRQDDIQVDDMVARQTVFALLQPMSSSEGRTEDTYAAAGPGGYSGRL